MELNGRAVSLPSPLPSPPINAPSPEPDNDIELPGDYYNNNTSSMNGFGSFLNSSAPLPFDLDDYYRTSPPPIDQSHSIQVVQTQEQSQQSTQPLNDFYNSLIPPKLDAYNPSMRYVGGGGGEQSYQPNIQIPLPMGPPSYNPAAAAAAAQNANYLCAPPPPAQPMEYGNQQSIPSRPVLNQPNDDYAWNDWNSTSMETPHSPPQFERKGHDNAMIEYIDESLRDNNGNDVDHRLQLLATDSDGSGKGEHLILIA